MSGLLLSTAAIAFLTYRNILGYYLTATDSLTLIETSRVHSWSDVADILTKPLMGGTGFDKMGTFYRPIATLSYSLDYALWKLNPLGYHLTDLSLHVVTTVLVFILMLRLTRDERLVAWLAAALFAIHPILVETVPAVPRRHDVIAAIFILLSLLLFLKSLTSASRTRPLVLLMSVICYLLALGSKEVGIVLPAVVFAYLILFPPRTEGTRRQQVVDAIVGSIPYGIVTLLFLAWRTYVLHGMGGYPYGPVIIHLIRVITIVPSYVLDLLLPADVLGVFYSVTPTPMQKVGALVGLAVLVAVLIIFRRSLRLLVQEEAHLTVRVVKGFLLLVFLVSLATLCLFPFLASHILHLMQQGYQGHGSQLLIRGLQFCRRLGDSHGVTPADDAYFVNKIFDIEIGFALVFSTTCLAAIHRRRAVRGYLAQSLHGKLVAFLVIWALLPMALYLLTQTFAHRFMYIPVIPYAALLAVLLVESFESISSWRGRQQSFAGIENPPSTDLRAAKAGAFAVLLLTVYLVAYSPLLRPYADWRDCAKMTEMTLDQLRSIVPTLPDHAALYIYDLPAGILSYQFPHVKTPGSLADYSIESWAHMEFPGKDIKVADYTKARPSECPRRIDIETRRGTGNTVLMFVHLEGVRTPPPSDALFQHPSVAHPSGSGILPAE